MKQIKMWPLTSINNEILTKTKKFEQHCSLQIYRFEFVFSNVSNNSCIKIIDMFMASNEIPQVLIWNSNKNGGKRVHQIIELITLNSKVLKEITLNNCTIIKFVCCKAMETNKYGLNISFDVKYMDNNHSKNNSNMKIEVKMNTIINSWFWN